MPDLKIESNLPKTRLEFKNKTANMGFGLKFAMEGVVQFLRTEVDRNLARGTYKIKTKSGGLRSSLATEVDVSGFNVEGKVGSKLIYARIQEEGGTINVTDKMRRFAWFKFKETGVMMWKAIALSQSVTIPAHWYLRNTLKENKGRVVKTFERRLLERLF